MLLGLSPSDCDGEKSSIFMRVETYVQFIERSLGVKLPTISTDGKAEVGRVREEKRRRKKIREEKESEERRCRRAKGRKVAIHCVFHRFSNDLWLRRVEK